MQETIITHPTLEPLTLIETKEYLRVTHSLEDKTIATAISAARKMCEDAARISISPQTRSVMYRAPKMQGDEFGLSRTLRDPEKISSRLQLSYPPVRAITAVRLHLLDATVEEFTGYVFQPQFSTLVWTDRNKLLDFYTTNIEVEFTCGYPENEDAGDNVPGCKAPEDLRQAILCTVAALYEKRGDLDKLPNEAFQLLRAYWNSPRYAG